MKLFFFNYVRILSSLNQNLYYMTKICSTENLGWGPLSIRLMNGYLPKLHALAILESNPSSNRNHLYNL